jgi:quercetin dioxygenase-like cupin family protein
MGVNLYEIFSNPIAGESFRCLSYDQNEFVMEWTVKPNGYVPFEHVHYHQQETFHVIKGELRIAIDKKNYIVKEGGSITAPKGIAHIPHNNKDEELVCIVKYKPALDYYRFFQCFAGLTIDGRYDKKGAVNVPRMCYFMKKMKTRSLARPTSIPAPIFRLAVSVCYLYGRLAGWKNLYHKYTGED